MARRILNTNFELVQEEPPEKLPDGYRELLTNLGAIREKADGLWYRVGLFDSVSAGHNRILTLKKRSDMKQFAFKAGATDLEGFQSGIWARFTGPKEAFGDDDEDDEEEVQRPALSAVSPRRRGPGRPRRDEPT